MRPQAEEKRTNFISSLEFTDHHRGQILAYMRHVGARRFKRNVYASVRTVHAERKA
jgi:hypothetical protein